MQSLSIGEKNALAERWLALTVQIYPLQGAQFLLEETDHFRNPVGHTFREAFSVLIDELFGGMNEGALSQALGGILRILAVQELTAKDALKFVFLPRKILREELPAGLKDEELLDCRVDELALEAFDLFVRFREQVSQIRIGEARRKLAVLEQVYSESTYRVMDP